MTDTATVDPTAEPKKTQSAPKAHFGVRITQELRDAITTACAKHGVDQTELATRYLETCLRAEGFLPEKETVK